MHNLIGCRTPEWGHTYLAEAFGKIYALRSLPGGSSLCLFDAETLAPIGEYPSPGKHSCHITLLQKQAVVCDYTSGTLSLFDLDTEGIPKGEPHIIYFEGHGPHLERQKTPHIHTSMLAHDGATLYVVDLGTDGIYRFPVVEGRVASDCRVRMTLPSGCGPRMCVESLDGRYLYIVTELSDEVLVINTKGEKEPIIQRIPIAKAHPQGGGHIALSPDGRTLYVSLRVSGTVGENGCHMSDGVAVYRVNSNAMLTPLSYIHVGAHPRFFTLSNDGCLLCVTCRDDNTLRLYAIDPSSGLPGSQIDCRTFTSPVCVLWRGYAFDFVQITT